MPTVQDFPDIDKKEYQCIYPQYIDKFLKTAQGRRMPLDKCVERPLAIEMYQVCMHLGVPVMFEPQKVYARQSTHRRGRLRVLLRKPKAGYVKKSEFDTADREIINEAIPNKKVLMAKISEIIPTLPNRQRQPEPEQKPITTTPETKKKKKK